MQGMPKGADSFIQKLAKEAGAAVLKRFGKDGLHYAKSAHRADAVTKADLLADKLITSRIKKRYPTHGIIAEESGIYQSDAEYVWVIDPIDGTLNFSLNVPLFGVMICLMRRKKVVLSAVYIPVSKELFFAQAGKGAYLNGKKTHCSRIADFGRSFGVGSMSLRARFAEFMRRISSVAEQKHNMMYGSFGSMVHNACYVACGKRDWMVSMSGQNHDFAPISLILKESGCKVTDTKGRPWEFGKLEMVAANPRLHKELLKLTKNL
jgi:myo-inositol-1(or 4)-monophosphatase